MRIAYFPDSFHEVNGVAHTSRNFVAYAQRRGVDFLCIHARAWRQTLRVVQAEQGSVRMLDFGRSGAAIGLEEDLSFDPLFFRHVGEIERALESFRPDVIHITGPSELGMFGAYFSHKLGVPLAASWHTNLHKYAAKRMTLIDRMLPYDAARKLHGSIESASLAAILRFYSLARALYAPNTELCDLLKSRTGKPCHLMGRGVDTSLFTPARRMRFREDDTLVLGYVGRLSVEKNVTLLVRVARELELLGVRNARFYIIGHGSEEEMLRRELPNGEFLGVLRGEALAAAYADMDLFVFPSHTDTFGNVVLEALASGVPAVVTSSGGPRFIVRHGETGVIASDSGFASTIATLARDRALLANMSRAARAHALKCSWDAVFDGVLAAYPVAQTIAIRHT